MRAYNIYKFIFYELKYAIYRLIPMKHREINELFTKKDKSQRLSLFDYFTIHFNSVSDTKKAPTQQYSVKQGPLLRLQGLEPWTP